MAIKSIKTKFFTRAAKQAAINSKSNLDSLAVASHLTHPLNNVLIPKGPKGKVTAKKVVAEDDQGLVDTGEGSVNGVAAAATEAQAQVYAQNASVVSDASGSSSMPTDLSAADSAANESGTEPSAGLSTAQMVGLGVLGAAAVGGITAIAIHSNNSSNNTDTTPPQIQSLSANSASRTITLTYNEALDPNHLPLASAFNISTGGQATTVSSIAVSGNVMTLTLTALSAGALTIGYTDPTTGNDVNAIQDTSGNDASGFLQGIVADGYISGAKIFLDINGNGIAEEHLGEFTGIFTNTDGGFFLPSILPGVAIIAVGGTNNDTLLPQTTPLMAPAGSTTINPLTTLVHAVMRESVNDNNPLSASDAASLVANFLRISVPDGKSLLDFDPLATTDAFSLNAQKSAAQIATILSLAASLDPEQDHEHTTALASMVMANAADIAISANSSGSSIDMGDLSEAQVARLFAGTSIEDANLVSSLTANIVATIAAIENAANFDEIRDSQIRAAEGRYEDNTAPLPITLQLANYTGTPGDGISYPGLVRVALDYSQSLSENDTWAYSINNGVNWTEGVGNAFTLDIGSYGVNSIQVKQTDLAGNSTISTLNQAIQIISPPTSSGGAAAPDLLALSGGGFKAMTADAGMLAGIIKYYRGRSNTDDDTAINVANILDDDMALSANSGSTWFLNLLGYSESFVNGLNNYETLFSTNGDTASQGDLSVALNPNGAAYGTVDGFLGVMGEAYVDYLDVTLDEYLTDVLARISQINTLSDFITLIVDSPVIICKMVLVAAGDQFQTMMAALEAKSFLGTHVAELRNFLAPVSQIVDAAVLLSTRGVDWNTFMQEITFAPDQLYQELHSTNFYNGLGRTSSLDTQSLIYALTISSDRAAIGASDRLPAADDTVFATITNSEAKYNGTSTYNFLPASVTSLGNSTDVAAPWLPSIKSGDLKVEYDSADWFDWGTKKTYDDLSFEGLSAFLSSNISSAAAGVTGSGGALADWGTAAGVAVNLVDILSLGKFKDGLFDYFKGLSPLVQVTQNANGPDIAGDPTYISNINLSDPIRYDEISSSQAASNGYLRMADGGYFDNSGLESGLSYLQANQSSWIAGDEQKDFDITMFIVNAVDPTEPAAAALAHFGAIGGTVERLFKGGAQMSAPVDISHPNSAIFDSASNNVSGVDAPIWSYTSTDGQFKLNAWEMEVETIAGNTMNIGAGYNGTIHYWSIQSPTAAVPLATLGSWNDYEAMYNKIIDALGSDNQISQGSAKYAAQYDVFGAELLARNLGYVI